MKTKAYLNGYTLGYLRKESAKARGWLEGYLEKKADPQMMPPPQDPGQVAAPQGPESVPPPIPGMQTVPQGARQPTPEEVQQAQEQEQEARLEQEEAELKEKQRQLKELKIQNQSQELDRAIAEEASKAEERAHGDLPPDMSAAPTGPPELPKSAAARKELADAFGAALKAGWSKEAVWYPGQLGRLSDMTANGTLNLNKPQVRKAMAPVAPDAPSGALDKAPLSNEDATLVKRMAANGTLNVNKPKVWNSLNMEDWRKDPAGMQRGNDTFLQGVPNYGK